MNENFDVFNSRDEIYLVFTLKKVNFLFILYFFRIVGNPNRKKMHIFSFVGIFEYIC